MITTKADQPSHITVTETDFGSLMTIHTISGMFQFPFHEEMLFILQHAAERINTGIRMVEK